MNGSNNGLLLSAGLAVLLGACGFGSPQAHNSTNLATLWHNAAQCVRDHGNPNFPDPTIDSTGRPQLPDGTAKPNDADMAACQAQIDTATRASGSRPQPTTDVAQMRQFAQCMRASGLEDWPDPDANGSFHLPPDLQGKNGPRWTAIRTAWNGPCAHYDPSGSISAAP